MFGLKGRAPKLGGPGRATTSLSLRWRVMLLAMSMVAMVEAHARMYDAVKANDTEDADGDGASALSNA